MPSRPVRPGRAANEPAINHARVEAIRAALANGSYRIDPQQIAARMDALEQALSR